MQEVIKRILDGDYVTASNSLNFSCSKVEIQLDCNCDYEGTFHILCDEGTETGGFVTTTDSRMECINCSVTGSDTEISYHFHGDMCENGDCIKGFFCIVSNHGEYALPFVVNVTAPVLYSSEGQIPNLFSYVNLAKNNWDEAVKLFYSKEFSQIFGSSEDSSAEIYRILNDGSGRSRNVEEFLISTGKKQRVEFIYNKKELSITLLARELSSGVVERDVEIVKNGWGYSDAEISCEGDFLMTEKTEITSDDYLGNVCVFKIFIDTKMCGNGIHTGKIIVENQFDRLEIPVEVKSKGTSMGAVKRIVRSKKNYLFQLTREYVDHMLGITDDGQWIKNSEKIAQTMAEMDEDDIYAKLFQARALIHTGRLNEAGWLIDRAGDMIDQAKREKRLNDEALALPVCYHWMMVAMVRNDESTYNQAAERVEAIYKRNKKNWMLGIIALRLPTSFNSSPASRWNFLEYFFNQGCNSPVVYAEAVNLINENATVARGTDRFVLQVIFFGARYNAFNDQAIEQILFLAGRVRDYSRIFVKALILLYRKHDDKRILQEICAQLIKGQRTDSSSFGWYAHAIEEDIRLTNLYEYYVFSINPEENVLIPKTVLMYFSYQNSLDYEKMAYIYRYMISCRNDYPEIFENNAKNIEEFADAQIRKGHINRDLAVIYEEFLKPEELDAETASGMSDMLFSEYVVCRNKNICRVYVYQKGFDKPWEYALKDGKGYVAIYGGGYSLVFEDKACNMYISSAEYTMEKLMTAGRYLQIVSEFVYDNPRLNMYLIGMGSEGSVTVTGDNIRRFVNIADSEYASVSVRNDMLLKVMDYYLVHDDKTELDKCLHKFNSEGISARSRSKIMSYLMALEQYDQILKWFRKYGPYFSDGECVKKFLERIFAPHSGKKEYAAEDAITSAAIYAFKTENHTSAIASYLARYYRGMSRELRDIRMALIAYGIPCDALEEKMLVQMLYTGTYLPERFEIASSYMEKNPETRLTRALVAQECYDYFAGNGQADETLMTTISKYAGPGAKLPRAVELAFLKYYALNSEKLDDRMRRLVLIFLKREIDDRIYLGFFRNYLRSGVFPDAGQARTASEILEVLADRTIIEYKSKAGGLAKINYMLTQEAGEPGEYSVEYMRDVCGGVCFKDFVIFFGEKLQYYITEEAGDEAQLTENGTLQKTDSGCRENAGKFDRINGMLVCETMKDYEQVDKLLEDYYRTEYIGSELFKMM